MKATNIPYRHLPHHNAKKTTSLEVFASNKAMSLEAQCRDNTLRGTFHFSMHRRKYLYNRAIRLSLLTIWIGHDIVILVDAFMVVKDHIVIIKKIAVLR